ncbi:DUF2750 domain-containing protein [Flavobacterium sp. NRK1]|uniref:DUF2750 domain-containing protein n=1 Tax=Flavobacterium sp. NRK1 TaxID=2954929 RepID=UPI002093BB44|nr:DUF2750 domain-containing protein [Flavobacterium sp. NRK1]MCO6146565.1 DUF2750 domain-containing protein [Flavobacterium sp. NRK1]
MTTPINLLLLPPQDRYFHFINTTAETGEIWTILDKNGDFALFEIDNKTVLSFWPEEAFIESNLTPDWKDCIPYKLTIDTLQEIIIPKIRQNNYYINVFPVEAKTGYLVNLNDFVQDLNEELE